MLPTSHMGGKIGVLVDVETDVVNDAVKEMARERSNAGCSSETAVHKRQRSKCRIYRSMRKRSFLLRSRTIRKNPQKPEKVIQGMITGRIKKELKEICLLDQVYVKAEDGKQTVAKICRRSC